MIKLNNKNITYVALADSNNSLKSPKEIWYADSSNSVKLVYRRKDALIEGEDYEKYHWLVSTGAEWINTAVILDTNMGIYTLFAPLETDVFEHGIFGASSEPNDHNVLQIQKTYVGLYIPSGIRTAYANIILNAVQDWSINLANDAKVYLNGAYVADTCPSSSSTVPYPIAIFSRNRDGQVSQSNCSMIKMNKFTIVKNSIPIITLIPCKLLKPVPKWLDANGIRRQVGECGMIDLVSGKFYGNVNSVGTFTVENYYERKVWLQAEISGVNTLMSLPIYSNKMQYTRVFVKFANIGYFLTTNNISYINISGVNIIYNNLTHTATSCGNSSLLSYIEVVCDSDSIVIDGELLENNLPVQMIQFYNASTTVDANFLTSSITIDNIERYIPCTLTMDLPASMDANNIARTKGTSGMWDLVNDRFYGNVASSGTFKAVNLAEGVDYEVHQWLVGDEAAYIELDNQFNTDGNAFIDAHFKQYAQRSNGYNIIIGNNQPVDGYCIRITFAWVIYYDLHKVVNGVANSYRLTKTRDDMEHNVYMSFSSIEIDGVESTIVWGNQFDSSMRNKFTRIYTGDAQYGEITMRSNNKEFHLIPVKLLRPIPSKYDANGIARQAGECGMYDTLNDVFYGNVASSGSFTVSDDN